MPQSRRLVVGNWKMNLGRSAAADLARACVEAAAALPSCELWIAPPAIHLADVERIVTGTSVKLGAQQVHWAESGAFTGELSPRMLAEYGCSFALVGHSERRHVFQDPAEQTAKRARTVLLESNLTLIYCVGETLAERDGGITLTVLQTQLEPVREALSEHPEFLDRLVIAYEPVWAIGTGRVATLDQVNEAHCGINALFADYDSPPVILYGGSVTPENAGEIFGLSCVGGVLVGGASLVKEKFLRIAELCGSNFGV